MAIEFRNASLAPLESFSISAPGAAIIGVIGEKGSGEAQLMHLAGGWANPAGGEVLVSGTRRYVGAGDALNLAPVNVLVLDHALAQADALVRARTGVALDRLCASGTTVFVASHEPALLRLLCDEIWWFDGGRLVARGDPGEVLDKYQAHISAKFRAWGEQLKVPLAPAFRRGDGRAEITSLTILGAAGRPSAVLLSGELVTVRLLIRFVQAVENPVIGILIRTRVGLEVYGTNTELERVCVGPCGEGDVIQVDFGFRCDLCPKEYTLTSASHDPDGTAHDWIDDAVAFEVTDSRYTAGVANLHTQINVTKDVKKVD